jgi:putative Holliday junction resolvase
MPVVSLKDLKEALPKGKRLMGLDPGAKTWGLALSNPELTMATPFRTIRRTKFAADSEKLAGFCREFEVGGLVIGMPYNMDGTMGPRCDSAKHLADNLIKAGFGMPIAFQDERLSTYAADQSLMEDLGMSREKRGGVVDSLAARNILQAALEAK